MLLPSNPASQIKVLAKRSTENRRPFRLDEMAKLLDTADDEWKGIILFGLYTGQRLGDIARLTWQSLDFQTENTGEVRFVTGKTGRRMVIPMAGALRRHLETLEAGDDPKAPLFPRAFSVISRAKNGESGALSNGFRAILEQAGLAEARIQDHTKRGLGRSSRRAVSDVSFHCLRHTATSLLKNAGVSDVIAREIIGHDSEVVSRGYTHINTTALREAIDLMPDLTTNQTTSTPIGVKVGATTSTRAS